MFFKAKYISNKETINYKQYTNFKHNFSNFQYKIWLNLLHKKQVLKRNLPFGKKNV